MNTNSPLISFHVEWGSMGPRLVGPQWTMKPLIELTPEENTNLRAVKYLDASIRFASNIEESNYKCNSCTIKPFSKSQDLFEHIELNHNMTSNKPLAKIVNKVKKQRLGKKEDPRTKADYNQKCLVICRLCKTTFNCIP